MTKQLNTSGLYSIPLWVNCFLGEVLLILVEPSHNCFLNLQKTQSFLYKVLKQEHLHQAYYVEIYYLVNDQYCFLELDNQPHLLDILARKIFNRDNNIFIAQHTDSACNWYQRVIHSLSNNFKSNQSLWLGVGGSLTTITTIAVLYGLTRPCLFDQCSEINQAQNIYKQTEVLLEYPLANGEIDLAKNNLERAINLLNKIPFWSDYYAESSRLKNKYQNQLDNLSLFNNTRIQKAKIISLSQEESLSLQQLEIVKQELQGIMSTIKSIQNNDFLEEIENNEYEKYSNHLQSTSNKIAQKEKEINSFNQAKMAEELADDKIKNADSLKELELVYNTWLTAIESLHNIQEGTSYYQESRILLKTYIANKNRIKKQKIQEKIAIKMHKKANEYENLAQKTEQNNQWSQAVNYWNMAITHLDKVPKNTFKWKEVQSTKSAYSLSLAKSKKRLAQITELNKISLELDTLCDMKGKICNYNIKEKLIKLKLKSHYLEQLWMIALQAKAEGNLQIQVELLNHLSTFEHRLQTISNQTGKAIEVYNPEGNLITVYHRQQ
ncbi:hypothetical protein [Crocosphaera sp. Alani8]|uniref:hypothetical protein n=1 Tax=Crocosphaera sp. Alani8 TaxID=3038952 RepID=UPI00313CCB61